MFDQEFKVKFEDLQAIGGGNVFSVNGKTGDVVLNAQDVGAATSAQVQAEANARQQADNTLNQAISSEAEARAEADTNLQSSIDAEVGAREQAVATERLAREQADNTLQTNIDNETEARITAEGNLQTSINTINSKIPEQATASNQLADKSFVNSSITTNTAFFRGTFDVVTDLGLTYDATHEQVATALGTVITEVTNNDYSFVYFTNPTTEIVERYDRYKYSTEDDAWAYEYTLNNSSFTANQWAAINSGITSGDVALIATAIQPTDYAGTSAAGVIKTSSSYGTAMASSGHLTSLNRTFEQYQDDSNAMFIGKGTLENVITGKGLVSNTDYATSTVAGVSKGTAAYGITYTSTGFAVINKATDSEIDAKASQYKPIVANNLDYAIEKGLGDNSRTWTAAEKTSAQTTIGLNTETWTFTLSSGETVVKNVKVSA